MYLKKRAEFWIKKCLAVVIFIAVLGLMSCSDQVSNPDLPTPEPVGEIPDVVSPDVSIQEPGLKISQLVGNYDKARQESTQNRTFERYGLASTDLGVPFRADGKTYILFGDSHGNGPSNRDVIAYTTDIHPEDGLLLNFYENAAGNYKPITINEISQGAYEVPMEGISIGNQMYIYHTTDNSPQVVMGRSVVVKSQDQGETYNLLYSLSTTKFINVSIVKAQSSEWEMLPENTGGGGGLIMFGSGKYRESQVYLAYQPTSEIENPDAIQYFSGIDEQGNPLWDSNEGDAKPVFNMTSPCVGEFSVSYNNFINKWIMLYNCGEPRGINMRTAEYPWGPWSEAQILFDPWEDDGYCNYIHTSWEFDQCDEVHDSGRENEWGGEYGPYQFENLATGDSKSTTIYFTMSTWNPYTVVLMKAQLQKSSSQP